jgi:hypothetical protein
VSDVTDDPLMKPASEAGFDKAATEAAPAGEALPVAEAPAKPVDDSVLPAKKYDENDLRAAVGVSPIADAKKPRTADPIDSTDEDLEDLDAEPRSFKKIAIVIGAVAAGVLIIVLVFLGRANSDNFALQCEAERVVPQRGRAFPPWGFRALDGDAWQALHIAPETRCQPRETDDVRVLERWMLAMILDEVNAQLAVHDVARLDDTEGLLKQCLLLTRPPAVPEPETLAADRIAQHKEVERLLGDVTYWRAAGKLHDVASALSDAAKQFDSAAAQHPRHASDAAAWAAYTRKLADQLRLGPAAGAPAASPSAPAVAGAGSASPPPISDEPHVAAPPGTALPVEPPAPAPAAPAPEAAAAAAPAVPVPTGGVLL